MFGDRFHPIAHVHFLANVFYVRTNRFHADPQLISNFLVDKARGKKRQYLVLALGKVVFLMTVRFVDMEVLNDFASNVAGHRSAASVNVADRIQQFIRRA